MLKRQVEKSSSLNVWKEVDGGIFSGLNKTSYVVSHNILLDKLLNCGMSRVKVYWL